MRELSEASQVLLSKLTDDIDNIRNTSRREWERTTKYVKDKEKKLRACYKVRLASTIKPDIKIRARMLNSTTYSDRLTKARHQRNQLSECKRERVYQHFLRHDEQNRLRIKRQQQEVQARKKKEEVSRSVSKLLFRELLVRILLRPIVDARICLIDRFSRGLGLQRCVRTLQKIFLIKRTKKRLQMLSPYQYLLVHKYIKRYRVRFAQRRRTAAISTLTSAVVINCIRNQVHFYGKLYEVTARK